MYNTMGKEGFFAAYKKNVADARESAESVEEIFKHNPIVIRNWYVKERYNANIRAGIYTDGVAAANDAWDDTNTLSIAVAKKHKKYKKMANGDLIRAKVFLRPIHKDEIEIFKVNVSKMLVDVKGNNNRNDESNGGSSMNSSCYSQNGFDKS